MTPFAIAAAGDYARVPIGYVLYRHAVAPGASLVHLNRGVALERIDRYNEATAKRESAGPAAEYGAGLSAFGPTGAGSSAAIEATRIDPEYWPARKNAGIALGNLGRHKEAIEQFEIYLQANPRDTDVAAAVTALRASSTGR